MEEKKTILIEDAKEDVKIMAERLAMLYYYFITNIVDELGEERTEKIVNKVIEDYGLNSGNRTRKRVLELGEELTLANYALGKDLPSIGWEKERLNLDDEKQKASKIHYCPLAEAWKNLDFEKWGRMYCHVDQAKYKGYDETFECFHDNNLLEGDEFCIVRIVEK